MVKARLLASLLATSLLCSMTVVSAQRRSKSDVRVSSYRTRKGTSVTSHRRSKADRSFSNNFSTKTNRNPYTGKKGYKTRR